MIFMSLHERMNKVLSTYADNELAFLLDAMTEFIAQTHEESKNNAPILLKQDFT